MLAASNQFFEYLGERERVRLRKEADLRALEDGEDPQGPPWTNDPILQRYKFTNVRRHHDRTSMELRKRFYEKHYDDDRRSILMNAALFRYFGTWEFADAVGWQDYETFDFEGIKAIASERLAARERVFTGAYVITNQGISAPKQEVVVDHFLKVLHANTPFVIHHAAISQSWEEVARLMREYKGFGGTGFMTKEILLDTTYTGFWEKQVRSHDGGSFSFPKDWLSWTPIGPGALRGAARILGDNSAKPVTNATAFQVIMDLYELQGVMKPHDIDGDLSPTDIQFGLCEFDKYERVRLGQGRPRSTYRGT